VTGCGINSAKRANATHSARGHRHGPRWGCGGQRQREDAERDEEMLDLIVDNRTGRTYSTAAGSSTPPQHPLQCSAIAALARAAALAY
jgi:hypothetical protein